MDSLFIANEQARAAFLRYLMQSCRCTYICLWIHFPHPSYCLSFLDGFYEEEAQDQHHPSSSSSSVSSKINPAKRLFDQYKESTFFTLLEHKGHVPGLAFVKNMPYLELRESDLIRFASAETQLQFYLEAEIKTAVFLGCKHGEIELGMPNNFQGNLEMKIRTWFPEDFLPPPALIEQIPQKSSSSSLRSLSLDSPDSSSLVFNLNTTSHFQNQTLKPTLHGFEETTRNINLLETKFVASRAFSPSSAFRMYVRGEEMQGSFKKKSMVEKFMVYFRGLMEMKGNNEEMAKVMRSGGKQFSNTQMHHMISERKRRQKLNENFQELKLLLPPGSKKDKASVLASTREYIRCLQSQILKLRQTNQSLVEQVSHLEPANPSYGNGVQIENVAEISGKERIFTLRVSLKISEENCAMGLVSRVLGFLQGVGNVRMEYMEAGLTELKSVVVMMRLKVEANEWDEAAFGEAVRRVVGDAAAQGGG